MLLSEQDLTRYDPVLIAEGEALLERALRAGPSRLPGATRRRRRDNCPLPIP